MRTKTEAGGLWSDPVCGVVLVTVEEERPAAQHRQLQHGTPLRPLGPRQLLTPLSVQTCLSRCSSSRVGIVKAFASPWSMSLSASVCVLGDGHVGHRGQGRSGAPHTSNTPTHTHPNRTLPHCHVHEPLLLLIVPVSVSVGLCGGQVLVVLEEMKASGSVRPNQRSYTVAMKVELHTTHLLPSQQPTTGCL